MNFDEEKKAASKSNNLKRFLVVKNFMSMKFNIQKKMQKQICAIRSLKKLRNLNFNYL